MMLDDLIHLEGENMVLTHILNTLLICDTIEAITGRKQDQEEEEEVEMVQRKIMGGGMVCLLWKDDELLENIIDMMLANLPDHDLGEIKILKSIMGMIGEKLMELNLELGMMLYLRMLQRSLNYSWQSRLLIWQIR